MNLGAFAGGLTSGLLAGEQIKQRRADREYRKARDERESAEHDWKKEDRENMKRFWGRVGSEVFFPQNAQNLPGTATPAMNMPTAPESVALVPPEQRPDWLLRKNRTPAAAGLTSLNPALRGFAAGGMLTLPDEQLARQNAPAVYQAQAGGLSGLQAQPAPAQQAQAQAAEQLDPRMEMQRQMLDGNLLDDPDRLTQIAQIAVQTGLGEKMIPWLEQARMAKQKGMMTGAIKLLQGNVDAAIDDLKRGGMTLADRPVKVVPDDPDDQRWRINIAGQGERVMDVNQLLATTMDPEKYFDVHFKRGDARRKQADEARKDKELKYKEREANAGIGLKQAQADYYRGAKSDAEQARAERYGRMGSGGGRESADRPEKIDSALKRRDEAIKEISADNLGEANPDVRRTLYTVADHYQDRLERAMGREMNAREINILTDRLHAFPLDDPGKQKEWHRQLIQRFGGEVAEQKEASEREATAPQEPPRARRQGASASWAPERASGGLADTQSPERLAQPYRNSKYYEPMLAIQRAMQDPNLGVEERRQLALQAQHIASAYEKEHGGRR